MESEKANLELVQKELAASTILLKTLSDVFVEYGVAAGCSTPEESLQSLRSYLADAAAMHAVMRGERRASELLVQIEKLIPAELFMAIVVDLSAFLAPRLQKFVEELADAGPKSRAAIVAAMLVTGMKAWEAHRPVFEHRMVTLQQLQRKLQELCAASGITDEKEKQLLEDEISRAIGADPLALAQVEAGDFAEVDRLFCERTRRDGISIQ
jgi:hypothetical protein